MSAVTVYGGFLQPAEIESFERLAEEELSHRPIVMRSRSRLRRWGPWGWHFRKPYPDLVQMGDMPEWVREIRDRADRLGARKAASDSATLSEFPSGSSLSPHVDSPVFEDVIAAVSVGPGTLRLYSADPSGFVNQPGSDPGAVTDEVELATGSLYFLLRPVVHAVGAGDGRRISLTFRRVRT